MALSGNMSSIPIILSEGKSAAVIAIDETRFAVLGGLLEVEGDPSKQPDST